MKTSDQYSKIFFITNMDAKIHAIQLDLIIDCVKAKIASLVVIMDVSHLDESNASLKKKLILSRKLSIKRLTKLLNMLDVDYIIKSYNPSSIGVNAVDQLLMAGSRSTVITLTRNPEVCLADKVVLQCASIATHVYEDVVALCRGSKSINIFNGRHFVENAIKKAADDNGLEVQYVEMACNGENYFVENFQSHDLSNHTRSINNVVISDNNWAIRKFEEYNKANIFFKKIEFIDSDIEYYALFGSSDDEYVETSLVYKKPFGNQIDSFKTIVNFLREKDPKAKIIFRVHPNLRNINSDFRAKYMAQIGSLGFNCVFDCDSEINSRSLAQKSKAVVVYGSTMGLEAAILGKKVINLHETIYSGIGVALEPKTVEDLDEIFDAPTTKESANKALIFFGKMFKHGEKLKNIYLNFDSIVINKNNYSIGPVTTLGHLLIMLKRYLKTFESRKM